MSASKIQAKLCGSCGQRAPLPGELLCGDCNRDLPVRLREKLQRERKRPDRATRHAWKQACAEVAKWNNGRAEA